VSRSMKKRSSGLPTREKSTLLAVGSNLDDLHSLSDILAGERWTIQFAQSCGDALRIIQTQDLAVVACEHELPDGSWRDLFSLAASLADPPPVVVVSRHADENLWAEVLNLGGYDVLSKPFEKNEVSRVMDMASRHGRMVSAR
jgi:DNA-binding NtrC family response regulator